VYYRVEIIELLFVMPKKNEAKEFNILEKIEQPGTLSSRKEYFLLSGNFLFT